MQPPQRQTFERSFLSQFLLGKGLAITKFIGPDGQPFGNMLVEYASPSMRVRWISDRNDQSIECADAKDSRETWYDLGIIREHLDGISEVMPYLDQLRFIEEHWDTIRRLFTDSAQPNIHQQLSLLIDKRWQRMFGIPRDSSSR